MIESATERDLPQIRALLERLHLPLAGVNDHLATMLVAEATLIRPADVPGFIAAQLARAATATLLFRWLVPSLPQSADRVVLPRSQVSAW